MIKLYLLTWVLSTIIVFICSDELALPIDFLRLIFKSLIIAIIISIFFVFYELINLHRIKRKL